MLSTQRLTRLSRPALGGLHQSVRNRSSIAVIGAGITGVTTARALMARGFDVTVFDRHRYAAMETSFANGGQLSASNAEVWNSWATIFKGIKWMLKKDAPLLMNPLADNSWHKYSWMMQFMAQIPNYHSNTVETVKLAIQARELLLEHAKTYDIDFNRVDGGILHFYGTEAEYRDAERVTKLYKEGGLERHSVSPDEITKIEPALSGENYFGGFFTPSDFTGDIHRYTVGLAEGIQKEGVKFQQGTDVRLAHNKSGGVDVVHAGWSGGFQSTGGSSKALEGADPTAKDADIQKQTFDGVVICAGVRSRDLAAQLGDSVNIYPVKGYSITVNMNDKQSQESAPWVSLLDDKAKIVTSRLGPDRFRIAGTAEFNGYNRDIRQDRIDPLINWCNTHFKGVSTENVTPWSGLRPMMPSMLPRVGAGKVPGVYYNTGHGHLGWTLSAATAEVVAETVVAQEAQGHAGPVYMHACNEKAWAAMGN